MGLSILRPRLYQRRVALVDGRPDASGCQRMLLLSEAVDGLFPTCASAQGTGTTFRNWSHETWVRAQHASCVALVIGGSDPALVFGEILGVIKGSERTIAMQHRCLDRDTYLSSDRQGMSSHAREAVYDLFIAYTKLKRKRQEYDAADRSAPPRCSPAGNS